MTSKYPPWIFAYLSHALGPEDAAKCSPTGRVSRCARSGPGSCGRLGYWFLEHEGTRRDGAAYQLFVVVWDGKTTGASETAIEYGMVDPDLPYGLDTGVGDRFLGEPFSCGLCAHPNRSGAPRPPTRAAPKPKPPTPRAAPPAFSVDEARREELERWAEKLETVNPEMARKVRDLMSLIPPPGGSR